MVPISCEICGKKQGDEYWILWRGVGYVHKSCSQPYEASAPNKEEALKMIETMAIRRRGLIDYLFETGKEKINRAGAGSVDHWAEHYVSELQKINADDKAEELDQYYRKKWGQGTKDT